MPLRYPIAAFRHLWVGGYDCRYNSYLLGDVLAAQIDKWDECLPWLRETMALGALGADRFPAPDPTAFLRQLGVTS